MIESADLLALLPHRFPFLLVDRIAAMELGVRITGIKSVTADEPFFAGRDGQHMIMPGLLVVEAMAQTGAVLLMAGLECAEARLVYFASLDNVRFAGAARPGDQLMLEITVVHARARLRRVHGVASVDGTVVCEADMAAVVVDRSP